MVVLENHIDKSATKPDLRLSKDFCRRITQNEAKNFYFALVSLPPEKRSALFAIYAWMRKIDDLADDSPSPELARERIEEWMRLTDACYAASTDPALSSGLWPAFRDTIVRYQIPQRDFHEIAEGALMDQSLTRYTSFDELYQYCYRVASVVGLVCLKVFGLRDPGQEREAAAEGEALGIAFQLTNILRDVSEDARRGRIYLPLDEMRKFSVSERDVLEARMTPEMKKLLAELAARAESYYAKASRLPTRANPEASATLKIMEAIYHELLRRIRSRDFEVFEGRIRVPTWKKLGLLMRYRFLPFS